MGCEKCKYEGKVSLKVNGKDIDLNPFVQSFIASTVTGMIQPLRGIESVKTLQLNIEPQ